MSCLQAFAQLFLLIKHTKGLNAVLKRYSTKKGLGAEIKLYSACQQSICWQGWSAMASRAEPLECQCGQPMSRRKLQAVHEQQQTASPQVQQLNGRLSHECETGNSTYRQRFPQHQPCLSRRK